jgi:hypothetical protein
MAAKMAANVAFFGLGRMGFPMAERLAQKYHVFGWNRSPLLELPSGVISLVDLQVRRNPSNIDN